MLTTLAIAAAAYVATNIDGLLVLIGFFSDRSLSRPQIVVAQFLGTDLLTGRSLLRTAAANVLPEHWLGFLGVVPIALGLQRLWSMIRNDAAGQPAQTYARAGALSVQAVTVSNGADNFSTYTPLFATISGNQLAETVGVFAVLTGFWCLAAYGLVTRPALGQIVGRWGPWLLPFVLIALGVRILVASGGLSLLLG